MIKKFEGEILPPPAGFGDTSWSPMEENAIRWVAAPVREAFYDTFGGPVTEVKRMLWGMINAHMGRNMKYARDLTLG